MRKPPFSIKRAVMLFVAAAAAMIVVTAGTAAESAFSIGAPLPEFNLKNTDGTMVAARDYAGKQALVVIFSCNHCPYAIAYQDRLIRLQKEFGPQGVEFVLINPNDAKKQPQDSFENMQKRAKEKNYPFPYLHDESQAIARTFGASRTPEAYVFGPDRKLVYHGRVDDNTEEQQVRSRDLQDALNMLLAGTPDKIKSPVTKAFGCTIKWKR